MTQTVIEMKNNHEIEKASNDWIAWKRAEEIARENRIKAEDELIKASSFKKLEGSSTFIAGSNYQYKISLIAKLDRKLDVNEYRKVESLIPLDLRPVKTKLELDLAGIRYLEKKEPEIASIMAHCITTKPAKTSVKVEYCGLIGGVYGNKS